MTYLPAHSTQPGAKVLPEPIIHSPCSRSFRHMGVIAARIAKARRSMSSHVMMNERNVSQTKIKRYRQITFDLTSFVNATTTKSGALLEMRLAISTAK